MHRTISTGAAVLVGGALGTAARWGVVELGGAAGWSVQTVLVLVNVSGAFALGWFVARTGNVAADHPIVPFVAAGLLGSFTTFSVFTVEAVQGVRGGDGVEAVVFVAGSITLGLLAAVAGRVAGRVVREGR